jgi:hypothetical protein
MMLAKVADSLVVGEYEYDPSMVLVVAGLFVKAGAQWLGTLTVQFFQADNVPAVDTALTEKEYVPPFDGVNEIRPPTNVAPEGNVGAVMVLDSLVVGV